MRNLNVFVGGRGVGKTYSTIDWLDTLDNPYIYMRNTEKQIQQCTSQRYNPYKRWNRDKSRNLSIVSQNDGYDIVDLDNPDRLYGYAIALSTIQNLRGIDLSDVNWLWFDEFIQKSKLLFDQFTLFSDFLETANRNRELLGEIPLRVIMHTNAQKLDNSILAGFGLIDRIEDMQRNAISVWKNKDIYIELIPDSNEVSQAKKDTWLYRCTEGTTFYKEAIENQFANDSFYGIRKQNIREYIPLCSIDNLYIYRHKSNGKIYICTIKADCPAFRTNDNQALFMRLYGMRLRELAMSDRIYYQNFTTKTKMQNILHL